MAYPHFGFRSFSPKYGRFIDGPTLLQSLKERPMAKTQKLLDDLFHDTLKDIVCRSSERTRLTGRTHAGAGNVILAGGRCLNQSL